MKIRIFQRKLSLQHAYELARAHAGAPGVDGVNFAAIEAAGVKEWLAGRRKELTEKTYPPAPVRRVMIPKPGGGAPAGMSGLHRRG
jgi:RNA-directed DNA polymerase